MIFPESGWEKYIRVLSAIDKTAARKFSAFLEKTDISTQAGRKNAIDYAYALATKYGEMAAAGACEMYDAVAEASGVVLPAAVPAETATYGEVAKTINGMAKQNQSNEAMGNGVGRLVKRAGADTTLKNAIRDGAEFAWVPHGDTCSFCLMLASNGWQKASKKTIKGDHAEHIHANCDCTFAIRFDGKSSVGGYDPDKYREMYENAEGDTWEEKLNSMRRANYAENADEINAQKREAYERRKSLKDLQEDDILKAAEKSRSNPGPDKRAIVSDIIGTDEYGKKMQQVGEPKNITDIMTHQARKTLWRRNGTPYEDLIFVDPTTGTVRAQRTQNTPGEVKPTEKMKEMALKKPRTIISIHNHPHNNLPSYDDLESAKRYQYGVVVCHNGNIYKYTVDDNANLELADNLLDFLQHRMNNGDDYSMELQMLKGIGVALEVL